MGIAVATALFAGVFVLRIAVGNIDQTLGLTYALPIAVAAVLLGRTGGLAAAAVGVALWVAQRFVMGVEIPVEQVFSRAVTFALVGGLVGHFVDRGRRTERELQDAEGGYRDLLERVPAIVYTAEYGPDGRWSYVSPKIESMLGYTVEEWIANPSAWYEHLHPDDREQALAAEERTKATGEPLDSEYRMIAKDGRTLWFRDEATVVYDQCGRPAVMQGVMLDITSRKRAEDELELRYAIQTKLAEAASLNEGLHGALKTAAEPFGWKLAAFWTVDEQAGELRLTDMWYAADIDGEPFERASRGLGLRREEGLPGRAWARAEPVWSSDVLTDPNFPRQLAAQASGLHGAIAYPAIGRGQARGVLEFFATEPRRPDPEMLSHLPAVSGLLAEFVTTRRAIEEHRAELKRAQEELDAGAELERANRAKSEFLSRVSHELRTPLNAILGFGQVLEVDELTERQRNSVEQIMKGGRHLLELVNDLLELSRIESGALRVSPAALSIADAVNDIVLMVEPLAAERGISIGLAIHPATPMALADEQRVKQVILNLLSNAIKYNRDGGHVDIAVQPAEHSRVAVRITDTGDGIASQDLERLFSPFDRLGAEQTGVEGTGLGLALSRLMVEAMQGYLTVSSTAGQGSTFTVDLPATGALAGAGSTGDALAAVGR